MIHSIVVKLAHGVRELPDLRHLETSGVHLIGSQRLFPEVRSEDPLAALFIAKVSAPNDDVLRGLVEALDNAPFVDYAHLPATRNVQQ